MTQILYKNSFDISFHDLGPFSIEKMKDKRTVFSSILENCIQNNYFIVFQRECHIMELAPLQT